MHTNQSPASRIHIGGLVERAPALLKPWPNNPRTHNDKQLTKLASSIQEFGFTNPVLIDETDVILSGHGRVQAALQLGLATVTTRTISGMTKSEKRAFVIADNKISLLAAWDIPLLKGEIELLIADGFEIERTAFDTAEIDLMLDDPGAAAVDDLHLEDLVPDIVTQLGDLWNLGGHRIYCGDALAAASYAAVMQTDRAQLVVTDAPYNVPITGHAGNKGKTRHREFPMAGGEMSVEQFTMFLRVAMTCMRDVAVSGCLFFMFMDWRHTLEILQAGQSVFGTPKQQICWVKDNAGMGSFYRSQHEMVHVFKYGDAPHINNFELGQHGRYRTNVWNYPGAATFKGQTLLALHPTVKPVAMIADALRDCSHRNGIVLDPFAGSGTILVAAERTGRLARAIELDPGYVDVAIARWQRVTGLKATLAATGQNWDEVREQRHRNTDAEVSA